MTDHLSVAALVFHAIIILVFAMSVDYDDASRAIALPPQNDVLVFYRWYLDVAIMGAIGFAFLYAFIGRYRYAGIGWTFWMITLLTPLDLLFQGFWNNVFDDDPGAKVRLSLVSLASSISGIVAVLISFGAWMGKISPGQLYFLGLFEMFFYSLNVYVGSTVLGAVDWGGTIFVHLFGAVFGLAATIYLSPVESDATLRESHQKMNTYSSDGFSLLGAVFLWLYWPSFNSATAPASARHRAIVNTVFALLGSSFSTFTFSRMTRNGRWRLVDLQNATLTGGVIIGACCALRLNAATSLGLGTFGGLLGVMGFTYLSPWMHQKWHIRDTAGIFSLHGLPAFFGAVFSALFIGMTGFSQYTTAEYNDLFNHEVEQQMSRQLAAFGITVAIAGVSGFLLGFLSSRASVFKYPSTFFSDDDYFEMPQRLAESIQSELAIKQHDDFHDSDAHESHESDAHEAHEGDARDAHEGDAHDVHEGGEHVVDDGDEEVAMIETDA